MSLFPDPAALVQAIVEKAAPALELAVKNGIIEGADGLHVEVKITMDVTRIHPNFS